jgi:hypothetical protein
MTIFEFVDGMTRSLAWPALIGVLLFVYRKELRELAVEMVGVKMRVKLVKAGEGENVVGAPAVVIHESSYFRVYSNGLIVQTLDLLVSPGRELVPVVYPVSFPNEVLFIQVVGDEAAWPVRASLSNCDLRLVPSANERKIRVRLSGL